MKKCKCCWKTKSKDDFFKNKLTRDGIDWKCKLCKMEYKKAWRKSYQWKESRRIEHSRERAIKMWCKRVERVRIKELELLLKGQNYKCAQCDLDIRDRDRRHLDHIEPIFKGWAHSIDNLQWLCIACNMIKWDNYSDPPSEIDRV